MTRYLSVALGAQEPVFSQGIQQLEQAGGQPSEDIRLSTENQLFMRQKLLELGLDPHDTTAEELYVALQERVKNDEMTVRQALQLDGDAQPAEVIRKAANFAAKTTTHSQVLALKTTVAKQLLRKKPPKNAMKKLGYRSLDSMLKHEPVAQIYAAAVIVESPSWHKVFREQYNKLQPTDFEMRPLAIAIPQTKHWPKLAADLATSAKHTMLTFKELGTVVVLPLAEHIDALAITTVLLAIHELNQIRSFNSYVKLQQVKPHFGALVRQALLQEPHMGQPLGGQYLTWQAIHRFYARHLEAIHPDIFEPHVQPDDLSWMEAENDLAKLAPELDFWQGTQHLIWVEDGRAVSFNMLDVALNYCNHLSFTDRIARFVRKNLWHELLLRYLKQDYLAEAVQTQLSKELLSE